MLAPNMLEPVFVLEPKPEAGGTLDTVRDKAVAMSQCASKPPREEFEHVVKREVDLPVELLLVDPNPPKPVDWLLLLLVEPKPPKPPKDMVDSPAGCARVCS